MRSLKFFVGLLIGTFPLHGCGSNNSNSEQDSLTVSAEITLSVPADTALLDLEIYASAPTRKAAVEKIVKEHNLVKADLRQLEGLSQVTFEANEIEIRRIPSQACANKLFKNLPEYSDVEDLIDYYDLCPDTEFSAHIYMGITVQPAEMVGDVIAYATLSEVSHIELGGFKISDIEVARSNAKAEAAGKIRDVAQNVADKSGVNLGRITKLSFRGDTHFSDDDFEDFDTIVVTGSRLKLPRDTVMLDIDPELIEIEERITATFEISE